MKTGETSKIGPRNSSAEKKLYILSSPGSDNRPPGRYSPGRNSEQKHHPKCRRSSEHRPNGVIPDRGGGETDKAARKDLGQEKGGAICDNCRSFRPQRRNGARELTSKKTTRGKPYCYYYYQKKDDKDLFAKEEGGERQ